MNETLRLHSCWMHYKLPRVSGDVAFTDARLKKAYIKKRNPPQLKTEVVRRSARVAEPAIRLWLRRNDAAAFFVPITMAAKHGLAVKLPMRPPNAQCSKGGSYSLFPLSF
nr:hypothetical protein [uncultured Cohaesibacter sp.]